MAFCGNRFASSSIYAADVRHRLIICFLYCFFARTCIRCPCISCSHSNAQHRLFRRTLCSFIPNLLLHTQSPRELRHHQLFHCMLPLCGQQRSHDLSWCILKRGSHSRGKSLTCNAVFGHCFVYGHESAPRFNVQSVAMACDDHAVLSAPFPSPSRIKSTSPTFFTENEMEERKL